MNANSYSIVIKHVADDGCYEAKVLELPDVAEYADTYQEAYDLAIDTIETTAEIMAEKGKSMPAPQLSGEEIYSGRVTLRLPKSLHAALAKTSEREGTSLNQMIGNILSAYRGFDAGMSETMDGWVTMTNTESRVKPKVAKRGAVVKLLEKRPADKQQGWGDVSVGMK